MIIVYVDPDHCIFGFWKVGLLFDARDPSAVEFRNAKALRIRYSLQHDLRATIFAVVGADSGTDVALNNIVAENDADRIVAGKVFHQGKSFGDAAFTFLISIVKMFETECLAVSQQLQKITR